jgi:aldehyde dehydrogenase (NAD(P)+)
MDRRSKEITVSITTPAAPSASAAGANDAVHAATAAVAEEWALAAAKFKGLVPGSQSVGEEWQSGPYAVLLSTTLLAKSLRSIARGASPLAHSRIGSAPGNRITVQVLPSSALEGVLYHGYDAKVWLAPGVTAAEARAKAGLAELDPTKTNGVGVVLGAGNITSIPPLDVLYEIVAHNRVVLLKLNPVMRDMEDVFRRALAPLIDRDLLRIVQGGGAAGSYLVHHDAVSHVHITGSAATHDVIVWGAGAEGRDRRAAGTPLLKKGITSELGGVGPVIVVPGMWSDADLRFQAEHAVSMRLHNGGYNCIAGQVLVVSSDWPQRDAFLEQVRIAFDGAASRTPWYPGSESRVSATAAAYPGATQAGADGRRLLVEVAEGTDATTLLTTEAFAPVLGVVQVAGLGRDFLDAAIALANDEFLGTLGANLIVDPATKRSMGNGFLESLAELRYGTIAVNAWTGFSYLAAGAPWGAFPGHDVADVQSGIGVVHNALLIDSPERTILTGAFRPFPRSIAGGEFSLFPKAPYFVTSRSATSTGKALVWFAKKPSWLRLPAVFAQAFRA